MKRQEKAKVTQKRIFNTAVQLFNKNGYSHTTISDICKITGVAKGTFYIYYDSKESIVKESYYQNLNFYMESKFEKLNNEDMTVKQQLSYFLILELQFAEKMGLEITTLAYTFNLKESMEKNNAHFSKRVFSNELHKLIELAEHKQSTQLIFDALESLVRGIMATWCFSEGNFDMLIQGSIMIEDMLDYYIQ
ncbi:TetR/AcrR family transcriptional regulator [Latilactobacillus fuchuensis]|uniref:HTH tetR-type domain-containing protein n=2 Tax=Latilactobacillus fuchuensis TaxID=164393 RepID=A0A2N9DVA8_9LACO|nr:TetR/AcrR family transcriptional regulator [Latilactobacillus fuchuensis]KRL60157.1 hypothetical protein FC69_GL001360 [Latilactobacillus fuchuensis DSM 14340 = JCM 11249]SPC38401.1 conserved hypothetical protein [Latilactobacillus fuchuensis]